MTKTLLSILKSYHIEKSPIRRLSIESKKIAQMMNRNIDRIDYIVKQYKGEWNAEIALHNSIHDYIDEILTEIIK